MSLARHGAGPAAAARAYWSQVHPVFMLPPVAASAFGAMLAGDFSVPLALLHAGLAFCALYVAHIKDGYVDFHVRDEDDDHPLTSRGCRLALAGVSAVFFAGLAALASLVDLAAALLTLPGWLIAYNHAPQLDVHPVGATAGYPAGIAVMLVSGYYAQAQTVTPAVAAYAAVFFLLLVGIKVIDDAMDYEYDRSIDKRTVAVALGRARARRVAHGVIVAGLLSTVALSVAGVFPPSTTLGPVAFGAVFAASRRADEERATMLLIRGSYVFLAALVLAAWLQPLR